MEFIVVIAIMAALVGILAPQFVKYVERSKKSTDIKNGQEIASAVSAAMSDEDTNWSADSDTVVQLTNTNKPIGLAKIPKVASQSTDRWMIKYNAGTGNVNVYCGTGTAAANHMVFPQVGSAMK